MRMNQILARFTRQNWLSLSFNSSMKIIVAIIISLFIFTDLYAQELSENVIVSSLSESLPTSKGKLEEFLWNNFANKPSEQLFSAVTTENWEQKYDIYSKSLVTKAKNLKYDHEFLSDCLATVKKHSKKKIAYLPVGAYFATINNKPVCIIVVKWEYPGTYKAENGKIEYFFLGHIRMFVYNKNIELVGYNTCM